jgi:hypothetical protein
MNIHTADFKYIKCRQYNDEIFVYAILLHNESADRIRVDFRTWNWYGPLSKFLSSFEIIYVDEVEYKLAL